MKIRRGLYPRRPAPALMIMATEHDPLWWVSINLEYGGIDLEPAAPLLRRYGTVDLSRLRALPTLASFTGHRPAVVFLQEGRGYDINGYELMLYVERLLRKEVGIYRGFLTRSLWNDLHQVVFVDVERIQAAHHWAGHDPNEGDRRYGVVEMIVDGDEERSVWANSIHLDGRDGDLRLSRMKFLAGAVNKGQRAMFAGDFNTSISRRSAGRGEPQRDFRQQAPRDRFGKGYWPPRTRWWWGPWRRRNNTTADTRALDYLIDNGWTDAHTADHNTTPTIHPKVDRGGEIIIDRLFTHGELEIVAGTVQVDTVNRESDHRGLGGAVLIG